MPNVTFGGIRRNPDIFWEDAATEHVRTLPETRSTFFTNERDYLGRIDRSKLLIHISIDKNKGHL